jgi:hypothetical protein
LGARVTRQKIHHEEREGVAKVREEKVSHDETMKTMGETRAP